MKSSDHETIDVTDVNIGRMADDERQIRMAAEAILSGSINSQRSSVTQHSITRTPDIVLSEDLIAGARNNGRISHVRRSFCLFVTFDLLLTFLMWLICTMISGQNLKTAFIDQVVHYHIKTSLFDLVMAAICRFTVLLLFYALLHLNHWFIVAVSTATSCAFLIAKVFLFDWSLVNQPVFQVLLIIISFIVAWIEAWFFDFRVIPQETQARDWIRRFSTTERSPLLPTVVSESRQYSNVDHMSTFFTPMDSDNSEDEDVSRKQGDTRKWSKSSEMFMCVTNLTLDEINEYKLKASKLLQSCYDMLISKEWKIQTTTIDGDVVSYLQRPKSNGRILKITGVINVSANRLVDLLFEAVEEFPSWNKLVRESVKLQSIDANTDIVYQTTSPQAGGLITARDFVNLRHRDKYENYYIITAGSISETAIPNRKHMIRGENGVSCYAAEELPNEHTNKCRFTWIVNTSLKGWLPQTLVEKAMSSALIEFMTYLRKYMDDSQK